MRVCGKHLGEPRPMKSRDAGAMGSAKDHRTDERLKDECHALSREVTKYATVSACRSLRIPTDSPQCIPGCWDSPGDSGLQRVGLTMKTFALKMSCTIADI